MKLLLSCALSASLHGAAAEGLLDARNWLPTLGPNFDAAVTQVEALSHVASISKTFLGVCSDPDINTVPMYCHDELVAVLSSSRELDRNATRSCQRGLHCAASATARCSRGAGDSRGRGAAARAAMWQRTGGKMDPEQGRSRRRRA